MNNKIAWIIIVLILLAAGIFTYIRLNAPSETNNQIVGVIMIAGSPNYLLEGNKIRPFHETRTLDNGTIVEVDGKVTMKNGTTFTLKENELLRTDGTRAEVDISQYSLEETTDTTSGETNPGADHGDYISYSPEQVTKAQKEGKKVVLFFHASWCPFCKAAEKAFHEKIGQIPDSVSVLKVDYDSAIDLKQKYSVTYQHTFVQIDDQGNLVSKWTGGDVENLKKYLK